MSYDSSATRRRLGRLNDQSIFPQHIETPEYPPLGRTAQLMGNVTLVVTIDEHGHVQNAEAAADSSVHQAHPLLQKYAIENVRHWTFEKPPSAPYSETIVYDFEFDASLPDRGRPTKSRGHCYTPSLSKVTFDLPERVTILTNLEILNTEADSTAH
jgi:TonB family protein